MQTTQHGSETQDTTNMLSLLEAVDVSQTNWLTNASMINLDSS